MSVPDLVVAGSLTVDNVRTAQGDLLPPRPGGNVIFAALGARLWSSSVGLVSRAGADYPAHALERLASLGLDLGGITRVDAPHGMNVAFNYAPDGSRIRVFPSTVMQAIPVAERGRFTDYTAAGLDARFTVWQAFSPDASDIPAGWVGRIGAAHLAAMPVSSHLSLAPALQPARVQLDSPWYDERRLDDALHPRLLLDLALLLPSEADLLIWRPGADPLVTAAGLARENARAVLVKRGSAGAVLIGADGQQSAHWPAIPVPVVDLTGAGDAFCGGFLAGFAASGDWLEAGAHGTVSASFAIGGIGNDALFDPDPAEAARRLAWVRTNMTRYEG